MIGDLCAWVSLGLIILVTGITLAVLLTRRAPWDR